MFKSLPGFRDFFPEDCALRNAIFDRWKETALCFRFFEFDGPVLESVELLKAKSGDEIVGQLFNFADKGGREVTLRPELTPTLARMVGAKAGALKKPVKWFNVGENFRYERQQKGRLRSFYQFNADILGEPGCSADAEVITLLIESLAKFGLTEAEFCLRLSDRTLWLLFLETQAITGEQALLVLNILDKFERESREGIVAKLEQAEVANASQLVDLMTSLKACTTIAAIEAVFAANESETELKEKIAARLAEFEELLSLLEVAGVMPYIRLDLGIVRGLAYYTGFVFEAFQTVGTGRALAGGGRYDDLVKKLGGPNMPAVGFGMGDVTLRDLLEEVGKLPEIASSIDVYFIVASEAERLEAVRDAYILRKAGLRVEYPYKAINMGKQFKQADQVGTKFALVYGQDELASGQITVKQLATREEFKIARANLVSGIQGLMQAE